MKKILALLFAVLMLLSLCSCKLLSAILPGGDDKPTASSTDIADEKVEFSRGTWNGSVYTNKFADLTYTLPEGWVIKSDEELAALIGMTIDTMYDNNTFVEALVEKGCVYDVYAAQEYGRDSVMLMFEDITVTGGSAAANITAEEYLNTVSNNFFSQNPVYEVFDPIDFNFCGDVYSRLDIRMSVGGVTAEQVYLAKRVDKYILGIVITAFDNDIDELVACFS